MELHNPASEGLIPICYYSVDPNWIIALKYWKIYTFSGGGSMFYLLAAIFGILVWSLLEFANQLELDGISLGN